MSDDTTTPTRHDEPMAYVEQAPDGTELHVYRASALDHCDSALMYALHGVPASPPPAKMQVVFAQGHENEQRVIDMLLADQSKMTLAKLDPGNEGTYSQHRCELRFANAIVRGHIDGVIQHGDYKYLLEVKALGDTYWQQWCAVDDTESRWPKGDLWDHYALQTSVYAVALGLPICFVCGHKDSDGVVQEIKYRWYAAPMVPRADIMRRLMHLEALAVQGMPKGECSEGHYPCPYYTLHAAKDEKAAKGVVVVNDVELEVALENLHVMQDRHKTMTEMVTAAKLRVEELLAKLDRGSDGDKTKAGRITATKYVQEFPAKVTEVRAYTRNYVTLKRDGDGK